MKLLWNVWLGSLAVLLLSAGTHAWAQNYPVKPKKVEPYPAVYNGYP